MPSGSPALQAVQQNSHGADKISEEDGEEEEWQPGLSFTCTGEILLLNYSFYILKLIARFQQTVNPTDRKFDKSFSGLVSVYCSHYLPVVTSKLFFLSIV